MKNQSMFFTVVLSLIIAIILSGCKKDNELFEQANTAYKQGNYSLAFQLYEKSCEKNNATACFFVGYFYNEGKVVQQDRKKSIQFLEKSCNMGDPVACNSVGVNYRLGVGVEINLEKAVKFQKKSCNGNYYFGCDELSKLYRKGIGVERDLNAAEKYFHKACNLGMPSYECKKYNQKKSKQ